MHLLIITYTTHVDSLWLDDPQDAIIKAIQNPDILSIIQDNNIIYIKK